MMLHGHYIVICRDDSEPNGTKGAYVQATRAVFKTAKAAEQYARGIAQSREPIVVRSTWPLADNTRIYGE